MDHANTALMTGGLAMAGGLAGALLGKVWTVTAEVCGVPVHRVGATPLVLAAAGGLALAAIVVFASALLAVVALVRHDRTAADRSGLALLVGLVAVPVCAVGLGIAYGDRPVLCW